MAKILLVDDSNTILKILTMRLTKAGHQIVGTGSDGQQGYDLYVKNQPELTLLDITMPNKDGRECLAEIKKVAPAAQVIMLSSLAEEKVVQECLALGALLFFNKADLSTPNLLESKVEQLLKKAA